MKAIKGVLVLLFTVWLLGAVGMAAYYKIDQKSACIQEKGFIKGLLSCDTDYTTKLDIAHKETDLFIEGLKWPFVLFSKNEKSTNIETDYQCSVFISDLERVKKERLPLQLVKIHERVTDYFNHPEVMKLISIKINSSKNKSNEELGNIGANLMSKTFSTCLANPSINVKSALLLALEN